MTELGKQIAIEAHRYLEAGCKEDAGNNRSVCVDAIQRAFGVQGEAWCAMFAWNVVENAFTWVNGMNQLPKTAGACDLLRKARTSPVLDVDRTPTVGSIVYRRSTTRSPEGINCNSQNVIPAHVGIVVWLQDDYIITIEGNLANRVAPYYYKRSEITSRDMWFIHADEMPHSGFAQDKSIAMILEDVQAQSLRQGIPELIYQEIQKPRTWLGLTALGVGAYALFKLNK